MKTTEINKLQNEEVVSILHLSKPSEFADGLITEQTILMLRCMFSDADKYRYYINTLAVMRRLLVANISNDGGNVDENHEQFPILKTVNELINVLEGGRDSKTRINGLIL